VIRREVIVKNSATDGTNLIGSIRINSSVEASYNSKTTIRSQLRLVFLITLSVFLCEAFVTFLLSSVSRFSLWPHVFLDAGLLVILLSPVLYFGLFRTLVMHIVERREVEEELRQHRDNLDEMVARRTAELSTANEKLKQEVEQRQQVESVLKENEARNRRIADHLPLLIARVNADQRYSFVNQEYENWFGIAPSEFVGRKVKDMLGSEGYEIVRGRIETVLAGRAVSYEDRLPLPDGTIRHYHAQYIPDIGSGGNVDGYFLVVGDITARKRAEEALQRAKDELEQRVGDRTEKLLIANMKLKREVEERRLAEEKLLQSKTLLQAVVDGISDPLVLLDKGMRVKLLNKAAVDYYCLPGSPVASDSACHRMFRNSIEPCEGCEVTRAIETGQGSKFERKGFIDPDRQEQVHLYPVELEDGEGCDVLLRVNDITEQRMFEKQLVQSEKMASLGMMVSSIAHEINNPNNFISFNVPILRDYIEEMIPIVDDHAVKHPDLEIGNMPYADFRADIDNLLENIEHGSGRITAFVSNLKEFSQLTDKIREEWVDLKSVIDRVLSFARVQVKKNVKSLVTHVPAKMPAIWCDPHALEQVLLNLLVNAAQAADKEDSRVELQVELRDGWLDHTIFEVRDNGSGMDEKTMQKIFDPFFTTKSHSGGTGLGLYVCHNLVESMRGRIEVESRVGMGSTFRIILPDKERRNRKRS